MNKRKKSIRRKMLLLACAGIFFIVTAIVLFISDGEIAGIHFPRADISHVGFALVGAIYLIGAAGMFVVTQDKKALIEENDERSKTIEAKSGIIAFGVQTFLLFTAIFLLVFTGYLNVVSASSFIAIFLISIVVFFISQVYLSKKL